jgi:D-alanine--poly(phosphoribitol) ligase subunit 1
MYIHNLGQQFKLTVERYACRPAVVAAGKVVTYEELDAASDAFACLLASAGIARGDIVCIAGAKQVLPIVAFLGCVKWGVTYSFFDPSSPVERLLKIFTTCDPALVVADEPLATELTGHGYAVARITEVEAQTRQGVGQASVAGRLAEVSADLPAYIMFTSGSTGVPKGAAITHQNVLNLIAWSQETYGFRPEDVLTNVNPLYFDNSVFDLFSSLFTGASLVMFSEETVRDAGRLMSQINTYRCTSWFSVPSMLIYLLTMRALQPQNMQYIKRIIFGGEGFPKAKLKKIYDVYGERIRFYNVYGPTECTCICSSYEISSADFDDLHGFFPLGPTIPNFDHLIVREDGRLAEPGEVGELYLLGPNVGLGYFNDSERTAASFVQNPTHNRYRDIVYRTGDLVYTDVADGNLHIVGRADNQIKHMGYRIELEEIENALSQIAAVAQAAVIHCEVNGFSRIVGFLQCTDPTSDEATVRRQLGEIIPQYMIPTEFVFTDILPKNANGKLDRKALKLDYLEQNLNG